MSISQNKSSLLETAERLYRYMIAQHAGPSELLNKFDVDPVSWGMNIDNWDWNPGVGVNAISAYYDFCQRQDILDYLSDWIQRNKHKAVKFQHVNKMTPFSIFPAMYRRTGEQYYLDTAVEYGAWIRRNSIRTQTGAFQHGGDLAEQMWADTVFMVVLFLARLGKLTGDKILAQEAAQQLSLHLQYLQDPATGVLFHGYFCADQNHKSGARWTRGNAWITLGAPLILGEIAELIPIPAEITQRYRRLVAGLQKFQAGNGLWHTVMDRPSFYQETSGSAGIACGILKSIHQRIIEAAYMPVVEKALEGILHKIDATGAVAGVSGGTPIMNAIEDYNELSRYPTLYGQGLTLMLIVEYLQAS
ncbi:MAG: glycoside hydrolase family 88 protein [Chloroflexi bacterium]|nr:glycoside hydrolase family 88 protein [Chloroflexota bacterium]